MYAIIRVGSDQYKVSEGDIIEVDRLQEDVGKKIKLEDVLMVSDGKDVKVGQPKVSGAKVEAEIMEETMDDKVVSFKYRRRKASALKKGHRTKLTALRIKKITA
jgi:large subunit ribosomal protein L21